MRKQTWKTCSRSFLGLYINPVAHSNQTFRYYNEAYEVVEYNGREFRARVEHSAAIYEHELPGWLGDLFRVTMMGYQALRQHAESLKGKTEANADTRVRTRKRPSPGSRAHR